MIGKLILALIIGGGIIFLVSSTNIGSNIVTNLNENIKNELNTSEIESEVEIESEILDDAVLEEEKHVGQVIEKTNDDCLISVLDKARIVNGKTELTYVVPLGDCEYDVNEFVEIIKRYRSREYQVTKKNYDLDKSRKEYENKLEETIKRYRSREYQVTKKNYLILALSAIAIAIVVGSYPFLLIDFGVVDITGLSKPNQIISGFFTENLEGDSMEYWAAWLLVRDVLHVNIQNANEYPEKIPLIENVIMSKDKITKNPLLDNDVVYYKGWVGALESIPFENTKRQVPKKFSVIESGKGEGDITIILSNLKNNDGLLGTTKLITDVNQNQILKAHITIYEVNTLSDEKFETIFRHEFGHAIGLAHSTAVEDLMHPTVKSDFPYISECNIDALVSLYDESDPSQVICKN